MDSKQPAQPHYVENEDNQEPTEYNSAIQNILNSDFELPEFKIEDYEAPPIPEYELPEYKEYVYEYFYKAPEDYYDETLMNENVTDPAPVDKYISYWQHDDASWIFSDVFMVLSIQTGFALFESGAGTLKNEANIMMKNAIDVLMGGFSYWLYGYGLSFGEGVFRLDCFCFDLNFAIVDKIPSLIINTRSPTSHFSHLLSYQQSFLWLGRLLCQC